ncbi:hypothetical protein M3649_03800 [Ureibacillus chungkukjangi]|uniref:hypothetical protein n=1 Tax=Ureibacillus chungkukjangi TaxID=1202712 RepID=UPI00203E077A|nr:hypothetical protein [Ureibacillus chungkukjangi]MCM3387255.1 hypothetical protein [Ureibacillus chungkukjangi]
MTVRETRLLTNNYGEELVFEYEKSSNLVDIDIRNSYGVATFTMSKKQLEELIEVAKVVRDSVFE